MIAYGHASARSVLRGRRAAELLAGRGAARRHAACGEPPDSLAREAPRPSAPRPIRAARRHRGVVFEPFFRDEVVLAVPAGHRFADRTVTLDELQNEPLVLMQEGAGVRQVIDDELREAGVRLRDLDVRLELGLQESARSAVLGGFGVTFISRSAIDADLAAGTVAVARVQGLDPSREISLVLSAGRAETRVAQAFVEFARARLA